MNIINKIDEKISIKLNKNKSKKIYNLVLSGGSIKGIAQLGSLHYLYKKGFLDNIKNIVGTSVGSINALLYIIGYKPFEIYKMLLKIDMDKFIKPKFESLISKYGMDNGNRMLLVVKKLMSKKDVSHDITFHSLYIRFGYNLIITGSCINDKKGYYFSYKDYPDMKIIDAIRISTSIPLVFYPKKYDNKYFIDGGCFNNYPINLFKDELDNTIGIFIEGVKPDIEKIENVKDYMFGVMDVFITSNYFLSTRGFENYTIKIKCKDNNLLFNQDVDKSYMSDLFDTGYKTTKEHMTNKL
jgi:NTE family protein